MNKIHWLLAIITIIGYCINMTGNLVESYFLWILTNSGWVIFNWKKRQYPYVFMFSVYFIICIIGLIRNLNN